MTCAEWAARLATLQAAELAMLSGERVVNVQDGTKRTQWEGATLRDLQLAIRTAQARVDRCNGCGGRMLGIIPVDANSNC